GYPLGQPPGVDENQSGSVGFDQLREAVISLDPHFASHDRFERGLGKLEREVERAAVPFIDDGWNGRRRGGGGPGGGGGGGGGGVWGVMATRPGPPPPASAYVRSSPACASALVRSRAPASHSAACSIGSTVAERPIRCNGPVATCARRSRLSARCVPRLDS